MLSACASSIARASARIISQHRLQAPAAVSHFAATPKRTVTSKVGDRTAEHAWNKSCYSGMDYTISDDATVFDMVEKMAAYDVGCLVTKDAEGKILFRAYLVSMICKYVPSRELSFPTSVALLYTFNLLQAIFLVSSVKEIMSQKLPYWEKSVKTQQ